MRQNNITKPEPKCQGLKVKTNVKAGRAGGNAGSGGLGGTH